MNLLLSKIRSQNKIAIAVASSGIAATLLHGGRTVHSTFNLSVNSSKTTCNIAKNSALARLLRNCSLILWDECSMSNKQLLEEISEVLQDITNSKKLMGGIPTVFAGDYKQTLPVIQRGTRADIVTATLKYSKLWRFVQILPPLTKNMRLSHNSQQYADNLLKIGDGTITKENEKLCVHSFATHISSAEELIDKVWPDVANIKLKTEKWISERGILAPLNTSVEMLNNLILTKVLSEETCYYSIDTTINENDVTNYPVEFLNSLSPPGLPLHELKLKIGTPIMLLRNIDPPRLCNGTRLIVRKLMRCVIEATILTGRSSGDTVLLPRIPLIPSDNPVEFKRLQFPIKSCFAMTINKAQRQTFNVVGVDLTEQCFTYGQLYVAASRVSNARNLFVMGQNEVTNIVYKEVL